jgi:uncharacterized damage-inducible protein DinB
MNHSLRFGAAILCFVAATAAAPAAAGEPTAAPASAGAALRADWRGNYDFTVDRIRQLAGAVPADKYGWRPAEGVRSVGEVVGHVAVGNYYLTSFLGAPMPPGITMESEKEPDPAKLRALLDASVEHVHKVVDGLSDADLDKTVEAFGQKMSQRALLLITLGHVHEHLGQLIAYARANGVVPPWSAAESKAAAESSGAKDY